MLERNPRYRGDWRAPFIDAIRSNLADDAIVLDIGSGRTPSVPRELIRPSNVYVGLDVSRGELDRAGAGAYDRLIVASITERVPELVGTIDLAVSWQVLEHVTPMSVALQNVHDYLRPGGTFVAHFSGRWSAFAVPNRLLPNRVARAVLKLFLDRDPDTVFPARYDACTSSAMHRLLTNWSSVEIIPRYRGAGYLGFFRPLQWLYLKTEDRLARSHPDLGTHYLLVARK
jgi:SAM-dependent methyltransferase